MKKILNIFVIGIFLMSMLPNLNLVSADNEIQLGESFHLGENQRVVLMDVNPGDDDLNDIRFLIINSENITDEMNLGEGRMMPAGINLDWMVLFEDEDNDERIGLNPERHIEGDIINADFDVTYTISILSVNYDEGETARYAELRVDRIGELANREEVVNEGGEEPNNAQVENIRNIISPQITEKQEALNEVVSKLKNYIITTRQKVETSESISESEKAIFIKKLNEKEESIKGYVPQIGNIKNIEEIESIKSNLKKEIKEIKPIVEKPTIKIHKDKISKIIDKLGRLSKKLEKITSNLDAEDKSKVKELNSLIESANKNIDKAQKLYKKDIGNTIEIKFLLKQATKDIKEAFSLVREILSDMEKDILYGDLETEPREAEEIPTRKEVKHKVPKEGNEIIENKYIELDETFELYEGQSAKLIDETTSEQKSVIITLKDWDDEKIAINVNYWEWSDRISNKYDAFEEDEKMFIGPYTIKILSISDNREAAKFMVERNIIEEREDFEVIFEVGDTIEGVTLISVDVNGNSCTVEHSDMIYTINTGSERTMPDGTTINVKESIPSNRQAIPDYCEIKIRR